MFALLNLQQHENPPPVRTKSWKVVLPWLAVATVTCIKTLKPENNSHGRTTRLNSSGQGLGQHRHISEGTLILTTAAGQLPPLDLAQQQTKAVLFPTASKIRLYMKSVALDFKISGQLALGGGVVALGLMHMGQIAQRVRVGCLAGAMVCIAVARKLGDTGHLSDKERMLFVLGVFIVASMLARVLEKRFQGPAEAVKHDKTD